MGIHTSRGPPTMTADPERPTASARSSVTVGDGQHDVPGIPAKEAFNDDSEVPFMTARTFFMSILVSMGGICFGYDTGQISGFLEMENFLYNFADQREPTLAFTWRRSGLIVGMLSIGTLFGALISAPIANHPKIGRRLSIFGWCMIFIVGNIIQIAAEYPKWYEMMVGRIVAGLAIGGLSVLVPMYQGESSPAHIRGAIVCCYQLFITIGIAFCSASNWFFNFYLAFFTPLITDQIDFAYGYVFAGCNLCAALLIYFFLIESNGKSLEEIYSMYLMHVPPRKSTGWNLPEDIVAANAAAREQGQRDRGLRERKHNLANGGEKNEVENAGNGSTGLFEGNRA